MSVLKSLRDVTPYAPTDWKAGDLITASKLNNIEKVSRKPSRGSYRRMRRQMKERSSQSQW